MRTGLLLLMMAWAFACAAPSRTASGTDGGVSPSPAASVLAEAMCELGLRCTSGLAVAEPIACTSVAMYVSGQTLRPADLTTLQNGPSATSWDTLLALQDSIEVGRVSVNAGQLARCARAIRALPCNGIPNRFTDLPECGGAFQGMVPEGERCITTLACEAGTICAAPADAAAPPCSGICRRLGESCRDDSECDASRSCSRGTCEPTRTPAGGLDEPCGSSFNLFTETRCQAGLTCSRWDSTGICEQPRSEGASCTDGATCAPPLECVPDDDTSSTCRALRSVGEGGTCEPYRPLCGPGLRCISTSQGGTCLTEKKEGEACSHPTECGWPLTGLVCDATRRLCVKETATGPCPAPTLPTGGCDPHVAYCSESGTCAPFLEPGASCRTGAECGEPFLGRYCNPGVGCTAWPTSQRCQP